MVVLMSGQTETHSLGFLSVADSASTSGRTGYPRTSCGRIIMQPTAHFFVAGSNPRSGEHGGGAADDNRPARIRTADEKICSRLCYHSTVVCCDSVAHPHCLEPSDHKYHALG